MRNQLLSGAAFAIVRHAVVRVLRRLADRLDVLDRLADFLVELFHGRVERMQMEPHRFNVFAQFGERPIVTLSTHMDTVPPFIQSSEDDEYIYGRGACDAKGIIAAQIVAAERLRGEGIAEIGLLFTVDEEQGSAGAQVANLNKPAGVTSYLINGEPTDNKLARATKGSLRLTLRTTGRPAHSAYPEQGESAIEKLLDVLEAVRNCDWPSDRMLGTTTCNIGVIGGGTTIADEFLQIKVGGDLALVIPPGGGADFRRAQHAGNLAFLECTCLRIFGQ